MTYASPEPRLVLLDSHGVYIPQLWCAGITADEAAQIGVSLWAIETCQQGPDADSYWDAWIEILDSATMTDDAGTVWRLWQDGDLWELPDGFEFPDD